jgi:hypothetical protein
MDLVNKAEIKNLIKINSNPCISIYMPVHKEWNGHEQDIIRFKNLLNKVEKKLLERNFRIEQINNLLHPAKNLLSERDFWNRQSDGMALFIAEGDFNVFKLPLNFEEEAIINVRYYIKPLLKILSGEGRFFLLTLDLNRVKLYRCTRFSINELQLPYNTPLSLDDVTQFYEVEKSLSGTAATAEGRAGGHSSVYHGHGVGSLDDTVHKEKILEFFHMLNKGVFSVLKDETSPLILTGVEFLIPIYKKANAYTHLIEKGLDVNPEYLSLDELRERSWQIAEPVFMDKQRKAVSLYERFSGNGRASSNIEDIVKAAFMGRVESLFVNQNEQCWGKFNAENDEVKVYNNYLPESEDLLDLAATHTLLNNGAVYVVGKNEMPCDKSIAAVFRY